LDDAAGYIGFEGGAEEVVGAGVSEGADDGDVDGGIEGEVDGAGVSGDVVAVGLVGAAEGGERFAGRVGVVGTCTGTTCSAA
jgi:hypothetical protein